MTPYEINKQKFPEIDKIGEWLDAGNQNDFIESVYKQASKRELSDRQIEGIKKFYERITTPKPSKLKFTEKRREALIFAIEEYLKSYAMNTYEMMNSFVDQLKRNRYLSEKQYAVITRLAHRYRKDIFKRVFGEK